MCRFIFGKCDQSTRAFIKAVDGKNFFILLLQNFFQRNFFSLAIRDRKQTGRFVQYNEVVVLKN
jgi:hypothetical protein